MTTGEVPSFLPLGPTRRAAGLEVRPARDARVRRGPPRRDRVLALRFLAFLACLTVGAAGPARAELAVLPTEAPGMLPGAKEALDADLYEALVAAGFAIQPQERTAAFIKDAVAAGLDCSLMEDDCALRAAVAAGADGAVVPRTSRVDGRLVMVLRLLDLEGEAPRGAAAVLDDTALKASILKLARQLHDPGKVSPSPLPVPLEMSPPEALVSVDGRLRDAAEINARVVWLTPGPHLLTVSAPGYESKQVPLDVAADALPEARRINLEKGFPVMAGIGFGVAAVGGVLLGGGAIGAGAMEALLNQPLDVATRDNTTSAGRVLVATALVGAAAVVGGSVLAVVGFAE